MADFTLEPGAARLGHVYDNDTTTPTLVGMLQRNETGEINLSLTWENDGSQLARWFLGGARYGDDPDGTLHRYSVPDVLVFRDGDGAASLLHCRLKSAQMSLGTVGEGTATAAFAVLGVGEFDYRTIAGLRSEIGGALNWFGHNSVQQSRTTDDAGLIDSISLHLASPAPVRLGRALNVQLRPHVATRALDAGRTEVHESALIETSVSRPRDLFEHLRVHHAARELISLSGWSFLPFESQWVRRDSDPIRTLDGTDRAPRWSPLISSELRPGPTARPLRFLFDFSTVGTTGFARWLRLRARFERGINPIMATLDPRNGGLEGCLALSTIGLDGLGYQLALDAGLPPNKSNNESQSARLQRVAHALTVSSGIEVGEWAQRAANANNGLKHANREMPDAPAMHRTLIENQLVFRLWVASRIGVDAATLERRLRIDPMAKGVAAALKASG